MPQCCLLLLRWLWKTAEWETVPDALQPELLQFQTTHVAAVQCAVVKYLVYAVNAVSSILKNTSLTFQIEIWCSAVSCWSLTDSSSTPVTHRHDVNYRKYLQITSLACQVLQLQDVQKTLSNLPLRKSAWTDFSLAARSINRALDPPAYNTEQ